MDVAELPFNQFVGILKCPEHVEGIFCLPAGPQYLNHLGTVHASALFTLAEASSGQFLAHQLKVIASSIVPVLRRGEIKYRKPATGRIYSRGRFVSDHWDQFHDTYERKRRALIAFVIEILDQEDVVVAQGSYEWFVMERPQEG